MKKGEIRDIEKWDDDPKSLPDSLQMMVRVVFKHPTLEEVIRFPKLKERIRFCRNFYKQELKTLTQKLGVEIYELLGNAVEYRGFSYRTTMGDLCAHLDESIREQVWIIEMEGHIEKEPPAEEFYYCLKVSFKIQYEGIRSPSQQYDEQIVLIRAESPEQAQLKLWDQYIPAYEIPYLNSDRRLVRWKFDKVLDHYRVDLTTDLDWDTQMQQGLEIYSDFRDKRLKKADYWDGSFDSKP